MTRRSAAAVWRGGAPAIRLPPMRLFAALAAALLVFTGSAQPALAKPPVWIVRDGDSEVLLFGSVHVLPPRLDWRPEALDRALARADDVWFELPIDDETQARISELASARAYLPPGKSLMALLSARAQASLVRACLRFHLAPGLMDRLEPWYAEIFLASAEYVEAGAEAEAGVEKTLSAAAPPTAERRAFETPEEQIAMFDSAPLPAQVASLEESLAELQADPKAYDRLVAAWMRGDLKRLQKDAITTLRRASPELYDRLVAQRNARWTQVLDARLKGHGHTVVVVGIGHLIGPGGVPARLRALGYSVEGP
jgi:uncharacterized protein YbaP (TraB family)